MLGFKNLRTDHGQQQRIRLAQEFQTGSAEGSHGLFGRFSQRNPNSSPKHSIREITTHDGRKARLISRLANHITFKHGHALGVNDPLPPASNQKSTTYNQIRTKINNENKAKFAEKITSILANTTSDVYTDVSI